MAQRVTLRNANPKTPYLTADVLSRPQAASSYNIASKSSQLWRLCWLVLCVVDISPLRSRQYATISKRQKTVRQAYGGSRCSHGDCVKSRILLAFMVEEAEIVKRVIKSQLKPAGRE